MKRTFSCLLALLVLCLPLTSVFAEETNTLTIAPEKSEFLKSALASVEVLSGDALAALKNTAAHSALLSISETDDPTAALAFAKEQNKLLNVRVESVEEANKLLDAIKTQDMWDVNVLSSSADVLNAIRKGAPAVRLGLYTSVSDQEGNAKSAYAISCEINLSPATFCVLEEDEASRELVRELQSYFHAVWLNVDETPDTEEFTIAAVRALTTGANGVLTKSDKALQTVLSTYFGPEGMTRVPFVVGHRGDLTTGPENSIAAISGALENGCDFVEVDLAITADREVILLHDDSLNRTTDYNGTKKISEMTLAEVRKFHLKDAIGKVTEQTVPTLQEALDLIREKDGKLLLEIKTKTSESRIPAAELIRKSGLQNKVIFISFTAEFLVDVQKELPGASTVLISSRPCPSNEPAAVLAPLDAALLEARAVNCALCVSYPGVNASYEQAATERGACVWTYTLNKYTNNPQFLNSCDGLTTDDIAFFSDMVKSLNVGETELVLEKEGVAYSLGYETYGKKTKQLAPSEVEMFVLKGDGNVRFDGRRVTLAEGAKEGAVVFFRYRTQTTKGTEYTVFSEPITFSVPENAFPFALVLSLSLAALCAVTITVCLVVHAKKKGNEPTKKNKR